MDSKSISQDLPTTFLAAPPQEVTVPKEAPQAPVAVLDKAPVCKDILVTAKKQNGFVQWIKDHKKAILIALLVIGASAALLGVGLAIGGAAGGALFMVKGWSWYRFAVGFGIGGKCLIAGLVTTIVGVAIAGPALGALSCYKKPNRAEKI